MHVNEYYTRIAGTQSVSKIKDHTLDFLRSHCYKPVTMSVYDSYTNTYRKMQCDCGHCFHCQNRKQNEWVTRMYAHCEHFKYVYFVTLTYNSVYDLHDSDSFFYMLYMKDALWHRDNLNSTKRMAYRPCVLVKDHYQKFLMRLRKQTGLKDITYVVTGEYGHCYGSPHWHLVLWSNSPISKADIQNAWSMKVVTASDGTTRRARNESCAVRTLRFGRVDFHDLVANGSLNTCSDPNATLADSKQSARNCFAYVCKYLYKREFNSKRLALAFNSFEFFENHLTIDYKEEKSITGLTTILHPEFQDFMAAKCIDNNLFTFNLTLYEKFNYISSFLCNEKLPILKNRVSMFRDFCKFYRPFVEVSRGTPIASLYFKAHRDQILEGHYSKPSLQTVGFVCPRYFIRKAREYVYGLREFSTQAKSPSFRKSNVSAFACDFMSILEGEMPQFLRVAPVFIDEYNGIFRGRYCYKDLNSGERIIFRAVCTDEGKTTVLAHYYKYNRSDRTYHHVRTCSPYDFCNYWLERFKKSKEEHLKQLDIAYDQDRTKIKINGYLENLMAEQCLEDSDGYKEIMRECYELIERQNKDAQDEYNRKHNHLG